MPPKFPTPKTYEEFISALLEPYEGSSLGPLVVKILDNMKGTEVSLLNMSEYHQLKKRKDIDNYLLMFLATTFTKMGLNQQGDYWKKRLEKACAEEGVPLSCYLTGCYSDMNFPTSLYLGKDTSTNKNLIRLFDLLKQNLCEEVISRGNSLLQQYHEDVHWEYRLSLASPIVFAQMKLGYHKEIITETFPMITTKFGLDQIVSKANRIDISEVGDYFDMKYAHSMNEKARKETLKLLTRVAYVHFIKGVALLGMNEAQSGISYIFVSRVIIEYNPGQNMEELLVLFSPEESAISTYYWAAQNEDPINDEQPFNCTLDEDSLKSMVDTSSSVLEKVPMPAFIFHRYLNRLRITVTCKKLREKITQFKNSVAVRSHFSTNLGKLQ